MTDKVRLLIAIVFLVITLLVFSLAIAFHIVAWKATFGDGGGAYLIIPFAVLIQRLLVHRLKFYRKNQSQYANP